MRNNKKLNIFGLILTSFLVLSGCSLLIPEMPETSSTRKGADSSSSKMASSSEQSSHSSINWSEEEPETNPIAKTKFSYTYKDYSKHSYFEYDYTPSVGSPKLLVIPIWFSDSGSCITESHIEDVREDIETAYFGTEEEAGWQSVKSYYYAMSQGRCNIDGVVTEWYEVGESMVAYGNSESLTQSLVKTASDWYFEQEGSLPRSYFDSDDDGFLDGVMLIYAAPDYAATQLDWYSDNDGRENFWAYTSWTFAEANKTEPAANAYFWASYDFMYNTDTANIRTGLYFWGSGEPSGNGFADAHTFIHEMGHMFGLPDYYDYSSNRYSPAGSFSMQDHNVGSHDPYSALALGWTDPYVPEESCTLTIKPFQNKGRNVVLLQSNGFNVDGSPFDEYILLELYTPTGLNKNDCDNAYRSGYYYGNAPQGPSETGIRIWHVDARLVKINTRLGRLSVDTANPKKVPDEDNLFFMMSNSYNDYSQEISGRLSVCGSGYYDYNILQLIRNDTGTRRITYRTNKDLSGEDLFKDGDTFTCSKYSSQFVNKSKLNCGDTLGWTVNVSITGEGEDALATLNLIRD